MNDTNKTVLTDEQRTEIFERHFSHDHPNGADIGRAIEDTERAVLAKLGQSAASEAGAVPMDDKHLLPRAAKAPETSLRLVLEWAGIAQNVCSRDGRRDSAQLWADAIQHLEYQATRIAELEAALKVFARTLAAWEGYPDDVEVPAAGMGVPIGDLRRAAAALGYSQGGPAKVEGKATPVSGQERLVHGECVAAGSGSVPGEAA